MRTRDRSQQVRGAHADEITKKGLTEDDVRALIDEGTEENPTTTLSGTPQPGTPYLVAARVGTDGLIYVTLRYTSLASTLRRFWVYHRKVKRNGTYGRVLDQKIKPTAANITANSIEVELKKGLDPGFVYNLVQIEAKLTDVGTNDGGNRDEIPPGYVEATAPDGTQLATFNTGRGQPGNKVDNFCQNSKFKWSSADWIDRNGTGDGGLGATACAKWRYALDNARGLTTVVANGNYWSVAGFFAGQLTMTSADPLFDPSSRIQAAPWNDGELFNVAFSAFKGGLWTALEDAFLLTVTLHDEGLGFLEVARTQLAIGAHASRTEWKFIQMPGVMTDWGGSTPTGRQWVRWHLQTTLAAGHNLHIDKVLYSDQQGAFSQSPNDLAQVNPPSTQSSNASTNVGYGTQPGNFPLGEGGAYLQSTE